MSAAKSRVLLRELGSSSFDIARLRDHPALAPEERRRLNDFHDDDWALNGAQLVTPEDFPDLLRESGGPAAMYIQGDLSALHAPTVAIVGTRNASPYGRACAQKFGETLARAGVTVVSGGAHGIDTASHKGALAAGGRTAAVFGNGVDVAYPAVNRGLFCQIEQSGCLVSQFAMGTKARDYKFLIRNHLIAALSAAVVVIEAPVKSGALVTASEAADLGREVFVVPANVDQVNFRGSFNLLRDGATLVYHPHQVLESLGIEPAPREQVAPASSVGEMILAALSMEPLLPEVIVERTGLSTSEVLTELTMLELDGRILRDGSAYLLKT